MKFLILKLKNTPEKFLIINGTPGMNLKITYKKKEFFFIEIFLNEFSIDCWNCFANKNDNVDPIVAEIIDKKPPKYPNIIVDITNTGEIMPSKQINKTDTIKKRRLKNNLFSLILFLKLIYFSKKKFKLSRVKYSWFLIMKKSSKATKKEYAYTKIFFIEFFFTLVVNF